MSKSKKKSKKKVQKKASKLSIDVAASVDKHLLLTFEEAMGQLRDGLWIRRKGSEYWLFLHVGQYVPETIMECIGNNNARRWNPSAADLVAQDWECKSPPGDIDFTTYPNLSTYGDRVVNYLRGAPEDVLQEIDGALETFKNLFEEMKAEHTSLKDYSMFVGIKLGNCGKWQTDVQYTGNGSHKKGFDRLEDAFSFGVNRFIAFDSDIGVQGTLGKIDIWKEILRGTIEELYGQKEKQEASGGVHPEGSAPTD